MGDEPALKLEVVLGERCGFGPKPVAALAALGRAPSHRAHMAARLSFDVVRPSFFLAYVADKQTDLIGRELLPSFLREVRHPLDQR